MKLSSGYTIGGLSSSSSWLDKFFPDLLVLKEKLHYTSKQDITPSESSSTCVDAIVLETCAAIDMAANGCPCDSSSFPVCKMSLIISEFRQSMTPGICLWIQTWIVSLNTRVLIHQIQMLPWSASFLLSNLCFLNFQGIFYFPVKPKKFLQISRQQMNNIENASVRTAHGSLIKKILTTVYNRITGFLGFVHRPEF
jgi:hypothetical protein